MFLYFWAVDNFFATMTSLPFQVLDIHFGNQVQTLSSMHIFWWRKCLSTKCEEAITSLHMDFCAYYKTMYADAVQRGLFSMNEQEFCGTLKATIFWAARIHRI